MRNHTILIADDSDLLREYVRTVLEGEGFSILTTSDGSEAVRLARDHRPDAIILDLLMPRLDGLSALLLLKGDPATREIPVLMVSGVPDSEAARLARSYGAAEFLRKPMRVLELVAALRRHLPVAAAEAEGV